MSNFTNSGLVKYTKLSPNYNPRTEIIDTITIHCVVGHTSLQTLGDIFAQPSRQASSNYGVDDNGNVGLYCEEKNRSWCSSSSANDQRAVTIEVASDTTSPYSITDAALKGLIQLCADICKRNNIKKLLWKADKSLIGQPDKQNLTVHRWFANKSCPGDYIYNKLGYIAEEVNKILTPINNTATSQETVKQTTATPNTAQSAFTPYTVKITASALNYRKGPGTGYPVVGVVKKNEVFTIVEEADGPGASKWLKLKSGAGWISLDFCEPITPRSIEKSVFTPYIVKITASTLNYRKGPGTNNSPGGTVKQNEVFTIVEEADGPGASKWGKLKSGAGWISLDFCQRM